MEDEIESGLWFRQNIYISLSREALGILVLTHLSFFGARLEYMLTRWGREACLAREIPGMRKVRTQQKLHPDQNQ
jgi:hypothetical protein